jgi:hypothetical protein
LTWVAESIPGAPDDELLALAVSTPRTLLTFDKDFDELAYRRKLPAQCGIVLFRVTPQSPDEAASLGLGDSVSAIVGWALQVITRQRIRMRPLPAAGAEYDPPAE